MEGFSHSDKMTHLMRQTLLRRFDEQETVLKNFYCREEGIALLTKVKEQQGTSGFIYRKKELVTKLKNAGIPCGLNDSISELEKCVSQLPVGNVADRELVRILHSIYDKAVSPADQIARLVKRLGDPEFADCSVRLSILKQFLKYTTYHTGAVAELIRKRNLNDDGKLPTLSGEQLAELADEGLFSVLENKLTKDEKRRYTLLRMADDLAMGRFRSNGGTKTALYMFAFAYDMTVYVDPEADELNPRTDLERNLFFDYYSNSLLRFISDDYKQRNTDYESEPLGDGINYKNFAEVIYIYYLGKRELSRTERLRRANKAIEECVHYADECTYIPETAEPEVTVGTRYTYIFKDVFMIKMSELPEERLVEFVCDNYIVGKRNSSTARIMTDSGTNSAVYYFNRFLKYDAYTTRNREDAESDKKQLRELCEPGDEKFAEILERLYDMLFNYYTAEGGRMTRNGIIAAHYHRCMNEQSLAGLSMFDLYKEFCTKLNPILEDSRYQVISDTNIYDMFVILMLYRNLNLL